MKAYMTLINFLLAFVSLSIDTEISPMWASMAAIGYFALSALLVNYGFRKGWMSNIFKSQSHE